MKVAIAGPKKYINESFTDGIRERLKEYGDFILDIYYDRVNVSKDLQDYNLIITLDLIGFEQSTLTDGLSYNLLGSKLIHILLHRDLENEKYLNKQQSISMFFFCVGEQYFQYLKETYSNIPYLRKIEGVNADDRSGDICKGNISCITPLISEVIRECRL